MTIEEIYRLGEVQYLKGRLDELYKGYVPNDISKDNRIIDARISKYEEKLKQTDETAYYLYLMELKNRIHSKERSKKNMKKLLEDVLNYVTNDGIRKKIMDQLDKY
jgi:hypothetical protein